MTAGQDLGTVAIRGGVVPVKAGAALEGLVPTEAGQAKRASWSRPRPCSRPRPMSGSAR